VEKAKDANIVGILVGTLGVGTFLADFMPRYHDIVDMRGA